MPSRVPSVAPSPVPSRVQSVMPSPVPSSAPLTSDPSPEESRASGSGLDSDDDTASSREQDLLGPGGPEGEEDDIDDFMAAGGSEPKVKEDIHDWHEL